MLAALVLKRKRVVAILRDHLVFTGTKTDRIRRSEVTAIVAAQLRKNADNIELIQYISDTMRRLECQIVRRYGAYYFRGVKLRVVDQSDAPAA